MVSTIFAVVDSTGLVVVVVALVGSMVVVGRIPFVCVSVVGVVVGLVRSSRKGISLSRSDFRFFFRKAKPRITFDFNRLFLWAFAKMNSDLIF